MSEFQLETERLILRELTPGDLDFMSEMLGDPETLRFWPRTQTREEAEAWINRHRDRYREFGYGHWIVIRKEDGLPIGQAGLLHQEFDGRTEIGLGYMFHHRFLGQGYAFEASQACLHYGFELLQTNHIIALIRPENLASVKLAERLGLRRVSSTIFADLVHDVYQIDRNASR